MTKLKNALGLSLIEVLISISILFLILTAIAGLFIQAQKGTTINFNQTIATFLAQGTIEQIKADPTGKGKSNLPPDIMMDLQNNNVLGTYTRESCEKIIKNQTCETIYEPIVNNQKYKIEIKTQPASPDESHMNLIPFTLSVYYNQDREKVSLEGYIQNEYTK
ncbi:MAG TPA: hypothetical protein VLA13_04080 [Massilibacterium sp.]|nr:hypothetical protein [Massilibacterium sp.]